MVLEVLGAGLVSLEGGVWPPVQVELGYDVGLLLILTATDNHKLVLCGTIHIPPSLTTPWNIVRVQG